MKKWHKVFKFRKYDVLLLRLCNDEDGEYVQLMVRIPDGQFIRSVAFGDDKGSADKFFDGYEKKHAEKFIVEFEKALDESRQGESVTTDV